MEEKTLDFHLSYKYGGRYRIRTRVQASEAPDDIQTTPIAQLLTIALTISIRRMEDCYKSHETSVNSNRA